MKTRKQLLEEADKELRKIRESIGVGISDEDAKLLNKWMWGVTLELADENDTNFIDAVARYFERGEGDTYDDITPEGQETGASLMIRILTMYDNHMNIMKKYDKDYKKIDSLYKKFKNAKV